MTHGTETFLHRHRKGLRRRAGGPETPVQLDALLADMYRQNAETREEA